MSGMSTRRRSGSEERERCGRAKAVIGGGAGRSLSATEERGSSWAAGRRVGEVEKVDAGS